MGTSRGRIAVLVVAAITGLVFWATIAYPFLNWDDQDVFVRNAAWRAAGFVGWAFTTTHMEHFQPLAWLTWGAVERLWGLTPSAAHGLNVVLHAACAALVFALSRQLNARVGVAVLAALFFAIHPLRVEVVAWASAMPYALAVALALASTIAFLDPRERPASLALAVALFALSLLARPIALGLPVALLAVDWWKRGESRRPMRLVPLAGLAALASAAAVLEWRARLPAPLSDVSLGARLTLALTAPFKYLWRTAVPVGLTPLDPLALAPRADAAMTIAAAAALVAISVVLWRRRRADPATAVAWWSYLALLVPAVGLVPSGLQATADRYMYLPAVPVSLWMAGALTYVASAFPPSLRHGVARRSAERGGGGRTSGPAEAGHHRWVEVASVAALVAASAVLSYRQMQYWRDSIALWTRAVDVDPRSDVALYNLASALAEAGRRSDAIAQYDSVLRIVPDHADARRNRDLLRAAQLEDEANRLAASGDLAAAVDRYRQAIGLDPARTHAQAALGMALVQTGRTDDALPYLREALRLGAAEPAVSNALAFSLFSAGRTREACETLEAARRKFPDDADVARNLASVSADCGRANGRQGR